MVRVVRVVRAVYGWLAASSSRTSSVDEVHHLLTEVARVGLLSERLHHQISGWVYTHTHTHTIPYLSPIQKDLHNYIGPTYRKS